MGGNRRWAGEKEYDRGRAHGLKAAIMLALGDKCSNCGENRRKLLDVDHRFGRGNRHRRSIPGGGGTNYYRAILRGISSGAYRLLCVTCHRLGGKK